MERGEASSCRKCDYIKVSSRKGYLASYITYDYGCGSADCPWLIEGGRGKVLVHVLSHILHWPVFICGYSELILEFVLDRYFR